jgi:hypothetical protein
VVGINGDLAQFQGLGHAIASVDTRFCRDPESIRSVWRINA